MIWTVHFAYDNVGWPSFERAAQMINDTGKFRTDSKTLSGYPCMALVTEQ